MKPRRRPKNEVAPRHIPQLVVPVPFDQAPEFVRQALKGTSLTNPVLQAASGWVFFQPHLRFTEVDAAHTRIELDVAGLFRGAETLLFVQRRGQIDRFFVAIQDELDRRELRPSAPTDSPSIDRAD